MYKGPSKSEGIGYNEGLESDDEIIRLLVPRKGLGQKFKSVGFDGGGVRGVLFVIVQESFFHQGSIVSSKIPFPTHTIFIRRDFVKIIRRIPLSGTSLEWGLKSPSPQTTGTTTGPFDTEVAKR